MKQNNNILVGLIGGSGSGKSIISAAAASLGFTCIDGDKTGHEIILKGKPAYKKLVDAFGKDILNSDGEINRRKLGSIVFSDKEKLKLLNEITHCEIIKEIESKINGNTLVDAAVLHTTPFIKKCNYVIYATADEDERAKRIAARDKITYAEAVERIKSQPAYEEFAKYADVILENNEDEKAFFEKAVQCLERMVNA